MADVRLVVVDIDELQRMIVDAVRSASSARQASEDWVDARTSGLGYRTFLRLAREGAFPVAKRGKAYVARRADVDAYVERQRIAATAGAAERCPLRPDRRCACRGPPAPRQEASMNRALTRHVFSDGLDSGKD